VLWQEVRTTLDEQDPLVRVRLEGPFGERQPAEATPNDDVVELLAAELGTDRSQRSWIHVCTQDAACIGTTGTPKMHNKFYMFSRTGNANDVIVQSSANWTELNTEKYWNNAVTFIDNTELYWAYRDYFADLGGERKTADYYRSVDAGDVTTYFFPRAGTNHGTDNDTFYELLSDVDCTGNSSVGTEDGRTIIRVAQLYIARVAPSLALREAADRGCWVEIVYREIHPDRSWDHLIDHARIQLYELNDSDGRLVHSKYLAVEGGFQDEPDGTWVWTGSPNWDISSLRQHDEALLRIDSGSVHDQYRENFEAMSDLPCEDGMAGPFECDGIDLLAFVPQEDFNGAGVSDLWGWTDPESGDEYVIIGKTNGVAFFRVTDPLNPVYLGELPNPALLHRIWHDIKVFADHAFIVSESEPHGMTVFDLTRLREVTEPQEWDRDAFYPLHSAAHNVEVNVDTGFAYIVGGNAGIVVPDLCLSGLHMVDINDPQNPTFAGCYFEEGGPGTAARTIGGPAEELSPAAYVHDTQCVIYDGPDQRYTDREVCFNSAEDKVVIVDVTDKQAPVTLGVTDYPMVGYTHQGWLTEDHGRLVVNDEMDETGFDIPTRSIVIDVTDLENPEFHFEYEHGTDAITHNNYIVDGLIYHSNYTSGLRVHDITNIADAILLGRLFQHVIEMRVGDVEAEALLADLSCPEGDGRRAHQPRGGVDNAHGGKRGGLACQFLGDTKPLQDAERRSHQCRGALIRTGRRPGAGEHHRPSALCQRQRRDQPRRAGARDQDRLCLFLGHHRLPASGEAAIWIQLGRRKRLINVSNWPIPLIMDSFDHLDRAGAATARLVLGHRRVVFAALGLAVLLSWLVLLAMAAATAQRGLPGEAGPGGDLLRALPELPLPGLLEGFVALCLTPAPPGQFSLPLFFALWLMWMLMALAMMLPAAAPMVRTYCEIADTARARDRPVVHPMVLVAGYLAVWALAAAGFDSASMTPHAAARCLLRKGNPKLRERPQQAGRASRQVFQHGAADVQKLLGVGHSAGQSGHHPLPGHRWPRGAATSSCPGSQAGRRWGHRSEYRRYGRLCSRTHSRSVHA
jgi:choice-of-anchor B domain-containing protein